MSEPFETTGGANVGGMNASWGLAKLTVTPEAIRLRVRLLGEYTFTPDRVVAVTRYTMIPIVGWGIQIQHCVADYPARVIFWCIGSPDTLLARIRDAGFQPQAPASAMPLRSGMAFRWQAIVLLVLVWNSLFLLDMSSGRKPVPIPGPFCSLLALLLVFAACLATLRVPSFQRLILKPGRSLGEIRALLNFLLVLSGIIAVVMIVIISVLK